MNYSIKKYLIFLFLLCSVFSFSQNDTLPKRGTIKVVKKKEERIYIKVIADFNKFNSSDIIGSVSADDQFQPFPIVEGYSHPFNYTRYFTENFKNRGINLKGKLADTAVFDVKILANGKAYINFKSRIISLGAGIAIYNEKEKAYEINTLYADCLTILKQIKKWTPGYIVTYKKDKFKGETVIKPKKNNVDVSGTITILFSTTPFETE